MNPETLLKFIDEEKLPRERICELGGVGVGYLNNLIYEMKKAEKEGKPPSRTPSDDLCAQLVEGIRQYRDGLTAFLKKA